MEFLSLFKILKYKSRNRINTKKTEVSLYNKLHSNTFNLLMTAANKLAFYQFDLITQGLVVPYVIRPNYKCQFFGLPTCKYQFERANRSACWHKGVNLSC